MTNSNKSAFIYPPPTNILHVICTCNAELILRRFELRSKKKGRDPTFHAHIPPLGPNQSRMSLVKSFVTVRVQTVVQNNRGGLFIRGDLKSRLDNVKKLKKTLLDRL
jgi:hypothetical protein